MSSDAEQVNEPVDYKAVMQLFVNRQESEATLNWSRNSYFLVVLSLLTLAYSQNPVQNAIQLVYYKILISFAGMFLAVAWLLIQRRSSSYIDYYKKQANILSEKAHCPLFYPTKGVVKGFEMRHVVYCLPIVFIVLLALFIVSQVVFFYYPNGINIFALLGFK
jgi:hypothetical protein